MKSIKLVMSVAVAVLVLSGIGGGIGGGMGAALASPSRHAPPGDTIVEVTGDAANGFEIRHYDGTEEFPPTDSEARAECSEYDARVDRVRCRTKVRIWYRDLGDLRQALDWAHAR